MTLPSSFLSQAFIIHQDFASFSHFVVSKHSSASMDIQKEEYKDDIRVVRIMFVSPSQPEHLLSDSFF